MSVRGTIQVAALAALGAEPGLAGVGLFDAPPVRAALPYLQVEEPVIGDWSTNSWSGREARLTVLIYDAGERPVRLRGLVEAAEAALLTIPAALGDGWRLATAALTRSRLVRGGDRWTAAVEVRLRLYRPAT